MDALARRAARFLDRHPTATVLVVFGGGMLLSYLLLAEFSKGPVLIGKVEPGSRRDLYTSLAATSGALVGFAITALSILFALPRGEAVDKLRQGHAWRLLNQGLLVAAALLMVTLVYATIALPTDDSTTGNLWLEVPVASFAVAAVAELIVVGVAFALVIWQTAQD